MRYTWRMLPNAGRANNLGRQLQKVLRGVSEKNFETIHRYKEAQERFIKFLGNESKVQKLINIQDKHLKAYAEHKLEQGCSSKYIKNELSAIRRLHNLIPKSKHRLMDSTKFNRSIGLEATPDGGVERAWTDREYESMRQAAVDQDKELYADILTMARETGVRLDEIVSYKRSEILESINAGKLILSNTKGSVPRSVPLTENARKVLEKRYNMTKGKYGFLPKGENIRIEKVEKSIQNFICKQRGTVQDSNRAISAHNVAKGQKGALTFHGLRHSFAKDKYNRLVKSGMSSNQAKYETAKLLGHSRKSITDVYLETVG